MLLLYHLALCATIPLTGGLISRMVSFGFLTENNIQHDKEILSGRRRFPFSYILETVNSSVTLLGLRVCSFSLSFEKFIWTQIKMKFILILWMIGVTYSIYITMNWKEGLIMQLIFGDYLWNRNIILWSIQPHLFMYFFLRLTRVLKQMERLSKTILLILDYGIIHKQI